MPPPSAISTSTALENQEVKRFSGFLAKARMKAHVSDEKCIEDSFEPKPQNHVGLDKKPQHYDKQRYVKGYKKLVRMIVV